MWIKSPSTEHQLQSLIMLVSSVFPLTTAPSLKLHQLVNIHTNKLIMYSWPPILLYLWTCMVGIVSDYACLISVSTNHSPLVEAVAVSEQWSIKWVIMHSWPYNLLRLCTWWVLHLIMLVSLVFPLTTAPSLKLRQLVNMNKMAHNV